MKNSFLAIFITLLIPISLFATDRGDYSAWPEMLFEFHHLNLELIVDNEGNKITGVAEYEISSRQDDIQDVLLFSNNISIGSIRIAGNQVEFQQQEDSLLIQLAESFPVGERFNIEISYEAEPEFGVHFNNNGTVWSSMLPEANRHWLPGFDHPRAEVTTAIYIRVPEGQKAVANGYLLGEEEVEVGYKDVGWKSDDKLPISEIGFVTGNLDVDEVIVGSRLVRLYSETGMLNEENTSNILQNVYDRMRETERFLSYEFPYESFNLIALNDDRWETRSYNSGMGYIFVNRGELVPQIANPVYAQWYGMYQRPEQWSDAEATLLYQAWLADHFDQTGVEYIADDLELIEAPSVYNDFSPTQHKKFIQFIQRQEGSEFLETMISHARDVLTSGESVIGWDGYARFWYYRTGENWFSKPGFPEADNFNLSYNVEIDHESISGGLVVFITPQNSGTDEDLTLPVILSSNGNETENEYEFSGRGDTLTISDAEGIDNIAFGEVQGVDLNVNKPFSFWLNQLRRDSDSDRRKKAAFAMENFSDQQDIQLALNGVLNNEADPEVRAAVLRALAEISRGASGVQSWFLSRLDDENEVIQIESLRALRFYDDDEVVKSEVFEIISLSENLKLVNEAISVYRHLIPEADFLEFVDQFLNEDEDRLFTYTLIKELYNTSEVEFANERVGEFLSAENPFRIRYITFQQLYWNDYNNDRWTERVKTYISDPDPRMRFLMMSRVDETLSHEERDKLKIERESKESDVRILTIMNI